MTILEPLVCQKYLQAKNKYIDNVISGKIYDHNRKERSDRFVNLYPEVVERLNKYYLNQFSSPSGHETSRKCRDINGNDVSYHKQGNCTINCEVKCSYNIKET